MLQKRSGVDPNRLRAWALRGAILGVVVVAGGAAWLANRDRANGPGAQYQPRAVLVPAGSEVRRPIYWVGEISDADLRVTQRQNGAIDVRYIPDGMGVGFGTAETGEWQPRPLRVTTRSARGAARRIAHVAERTGSAPRSIEGRPVVAMDGTHARFAPRRGIVVDVYDPSPGNALRLILAGAVQPARRL